MKRYDHIESGHKAFFDMIHAFIAAIHNIQEDFISSIMWNEVGQLAGHWVGVYKKVAAKPAIYI